MQSKENKYGTHNQTGMRGLNCKAAGTKGLEHYWICSLLFGLQRLDKNMFLFFIFLK